MSESGGSSGPKNIRGWKSRPLATLPDRDNTSRLTLDFSGPLLPLPEVAQRSFAPAAPAAPAEAAGSPGQSDAPGRGTAVARAADAGAARLGRGHDAWAVDHMRRSTPPPMQVRPGWLEQGLDRSARPPSEPPAARREASLAVPAQGSAFDLVDSARPQLAAVDLHREMADRFALGDFSGALGVAELILGTRGGDPAASKYADACREKLEQFYVSRFGSLAAVLRVIVRESDVRWLGLDHRAGFLLSRVDGSLTIDELLDTSGMPRLEALRTLSDLIDQRAIELVRPSVLPARR